MQPESRLEKIINTLDLDPVLAKLNKPDEKKVGPKSYPVYAMFNALIAMRLENMNTFTQLVERLTHDPQLMYVCGFEPFGTAPSISCFSRFKENLGLETGLNVRKINKVATHAYLCAITMIAVVIAVNQESSTKSLAA
ncbi:MAG: transposase [Syntrophomonadaceae bacterium]|nr:transposase [Syntrophomonadaceae bacterium]MDD4548565.1 transposase [Syntrophomonadaceae bacterium]